MPDRPWGIGDIWRLNRAVEEKLSGESATANTHILRLNITVTRTWLSWGWEFIRLRFFSFPCCGRNVNISFGRECWNTSSPESVVQLWTELISLIVARGPECSIVWGSGGMFFRKSSRQPPSAIKTPPQQPVIYTHRPFTVGCCGDVDTNPVRISADDCVAVSKTFELSGVFVCENATLSQTDCLCPMKISARLANVYCAVLWPSNCVQIGLLNPNFDGSAVGPLR